MMAEIELIHDDNMVIDVLMVLYVAIYAGQLVYGLCHPEDPFWQGFTFR